MHTFYTRARVDDYCIFFFYFLRRNSARTHKILGVDIQCANTIKLFGLVHAASCTVTQITNITLIYINNVHLRFGEKYQALEIHAAQNRAYIIGIYHRTVRNCVYFTPCLFDVFIIVWCCFYYGFYDAVCILGILLFFLLRR